MNESFFESFGSFCSLNELNDSKKDLFIMMNEFEQESHERASQNRARRAFVLIKLKLLFLFFIFMADRFARLDPYSSSGVV